MGLLARQWSPRDAAEVDFDLFVEDDVGGGDLDRSWRRHLCLDMRSMLRGRKSCANAPVKAVVAPIPFGELGQALSGQCVRDHDPAHLGPAEHVLPMPVGVDDRIRARTARTKGRVEE